MTVKSPYKLDDRIESMDDVQTCLRYDDSYIGERGYFASDLCDLSDLSSCVHGTLAQIILDGVGDDIFRTPHDVEYGNWGSRFFVPERLLKPVEKKYRAFTIKEFQQKYSVGSVFQIRQKQNRFTESVVQYVGYKVYEERIYLGITDFTLDELFENFEMIEPQSDTWHPFGVKE